MEKTYENLLNFWNQTFSFDSPYKVESKWCTEEPFNSLIKQGLLNAKSVLDYGSESGWGLFELYFTSPFEEGLGIDLSENGVKVGNESAKLSKLDDKIKFKQGDFSLIKNKKFDFISMINVLDVVPDEVTNELIINLAQTLNKDKYAFVGINHIFTEDEIQRLNFEMNGHYIYKDGILRCNQKTIDEWKSLFSPFFDIVYAGNYCLTSNESKYPRVGFLLKKK